MKKRINEENQTYQIELAKWDCAIVFARDGVHYLGTNPYDLKTAEVFEAVFEQNPYTGYWFDAVEMIQDHMEKDDKSYDSDFQKRVWKSSDN